MNMTSFLKTHGPDLVNLTDLSGVIDVPVRVGSSALDLFHDDLSQELDRLEIRFRDFVTRDSLGTALKRNR